MNHVNVNDKVIVVVKEVNELGLLVNILSYSECERFIPLSEKHLQSKKMKQKYKVGTQHHAIVLRCDPINGYIDLELVML